MENTTISQECINNLILKLQQQAVIDSANLLYQDYMNNLRNLVISGSKLNEMNILYRSLFSNSNDVNPFNFDISNVFCNYSLDGNNEIKNLTTTNTAIEKVEKEKLKQKKLRKLKLAKMENEDGCCGEKENKKCCGEKEKEKAKVEEDAKKNEAEADAEENDSNSNSGSNSNSNSSTNNNSNNSNNSNNNIISSNEKEKNTKTIRFFIEKNKNDDNIFLEKKNLLIKEILIENKDNKDKSEKRFICMHNDNTCGKEYRSKENLILHIKNKHQGEKPYFCSFCGKRYSHRSGKIKIK